MKFLNKKQLAFILDIPVIDARAKMCTAYCKEKGIENKAFYVENDKLIDSYPDTMEIEMLSKQLNLPTLQAMVDDIETGYLKRPAAKKWILCDFPEKKLKYCEVQEKKFTLSIPTGLKSMLPTQVQQEIINEWKERFPKAIVKP